MTVTHRTQSTRRRARPGTAGTGQTGDSATRDRAATSHVDPTAPEPRRPDGAWRDGDPVGRRQFAHVGDIELERGGVLPDVRIAY